jgi:hypothetical protein
MKNILYLFALLFSLSCFGQDDYNEMIFEQIYLKVGRNNAKFITNDNNDSSFSGNSYELGVVLPTRNFDDKISVTAAITLDEYASYEIVPSTPSFAGEKKDLRFLGFQGLAKYNFLDLNELISIPIKINIEGGLNLNHHIASGFKDADDYIKQLYRGLFIKPIIGLNLQFQVNDHITLESEYKLSYSYGLWNGISSDRDVAYFNFFNNDSDFNIVNHQIHFGIFVSLN